MDQLDLQAYIKAQRGNASALAEKLGLSLSYISQMASARVAISPERCVDIEKATGGVVTRRALRPDDWHRIWPELVTKDHPAPTDDALPASMRAAA